MAKIKSGLFKNPRTTILSFIAGLTMLLGQVTAFLDNDPETVVQYSQIVAGLGLLGFGVVSKDAD